MSLINVMQLKAANYYWVGGSGEWADYATHWATTSNGQLFYTQVPTPNDNVYFDNHSFSSSGNTITINQTTIYCQDMDWTGATNTPIINTKAGSTLKIYGSLKLIRNMNWFSENVSFEATTAGQTITSTGKTFQNHVYFNGIGGEWDLQDSLTLSNESFIYLNHGILNTNDMVVRCGGMKSNNTNIRSLNLGSSKIYLLNYSGYNNVSNVWDFSVTSNLTFTAGISTISLIINPDVTTSYEMHLGNLSYYSINVYDSLGGTQNSICTLWGGKTIYQLQFQNIEKGILSYNESIPEIHKGLFYTNVEINTNCVFDSLILSKAKTYVLAAGTTQTINQNLSADGNCSNLIHILSSEAGLSANIIKPTDSICVNFVTLKDISGTGGAWFKASNAIDLGGNVNWSFISITPRDLYWVGGSGEWDDSHHWSVTSGGTEGACIPMPNDNVYFDVMSFNSTRQYVTIDGNAYVKNIQWSDNISKLNKIESSDDGKLYVYGSMNFGSETSGYLKEVNFKSNSFGTSVSTGNVKFNNVSFSGQGGEWTLYDSLYVLNDINLEHGILKTNGQYINCSNFISSNTNSRSLFLDSSIVQINDSWYFNNTQNLNFYSQASTIILTGSKNDYPQLTGHLNYHNVIFDHPTYAFLHLGGSIYNLTISSKDGATLNFTYSIHKAHFLTNVALLNSCTFDTLQLTSGKIYTFAPATTITINNNLDAKGECGNSITLKNQSFANFPVIFQSQIDTIFCSNLVLQGIHAKGAVFVASNSIDLGENNGWEINAPHFRTLYWIGDAGNWSDPAHWSTISGGVGGACIPSSIDDVYFDVNSFSLQNQTVGIDVIDAYCKNMDWTGVVKNPILYGNTNSNLRVYGSLKIDSTMNYNLQGNLAFNSDSLNNTITVSNKVLNSEISFSGRGMWTLLDSLYTNRFINFGRGTLNTNDKNIKCLSFNAASSFEQHLKLGSSKIYIQYFWQDNIIDNSLDAGTSTIIFKDDIPNRSFQSLSPFYDIVINDSHPSGFILRLPASHNLSAIGSGKILIDKSIRISKATLSINAAINKNCSFDTLVLAPGKTYVVHSGTTQTINGELIALGDGNYPIELIASETSQQAYLTKTEGEVCADYLQLNDIYVTGGATWYLGLHSSNINNNVGWIPGSCDSLYSDIWPGDANSDLEVNAQDILAIGLAYDQIGIPRSKASIEWIPQPAIDFNTQFPNSVNTKHADCNGDGIINDADTSAVNLNFSLTHNKKEKTLTTNTNDPDLYFITSTNLVTPGAEINVDLWLGDKVKPVNNIYGIAFDISFDNNLVEFVNFSFPSNFLENVSSSILKISKADQSNGKFYGAIVKTNHTNVDGYGKLGVIKLKINSNIDSLTHLQLKITDYKAIDSIGRAIDLNVSSSLITIEQLPTNIIQERESSLAIYPNPSSGRFIIQNDGQQKFNVEIVIYSLLGEKVYHITSFDLKTEIDISTLAKGVYFMKIFNNMNRSVNIKKFIIQ